MTHSLAHPLIVAIVMTVCTATCMQAQIDTFFAADGLLVIEAEAAQNRDRWVARANIRGFTGASYLYYDGPDNFNRPGQSRLDYGLAIDSPGVYRVQWRSRIALGTENTEHNDSWLRFPDADDFYATRVGSTVYPKGTGKEPNPEGSSRDGWFKVYQNTVGNWAWRTATSDRDPHDIYVRFDTAGVYRMQISGRSRGHGIDRIVLYQGARMGSTARNPNTPPSRSTVKASSLQGPPALAFDRIAPNPATDRVLLRSSVFDGDSVHVQVTAVDGRTVDLGRYAPVASEITIDVSNLAAGTYTLLALTQGRRVGGRLVVH